MTMSRTPITGSQPIHYQDATTLAALIRARQLSSREVVQAHLDRIGADPWIRSATGLRVK